MKREMTKKTNRVNRWVQKFSGRAQSAMVPFAILAMWATNGAYPGLAQQSAQPTFQSTAEASQTLFQAVQSNNEEAIAKSLEDRRNSPPRVIQARIRSTAKCSSKNTRRCTAWVATPTDR